MVVPSDQDEDFTYGQACRPSTPIKAVVGNFYGECAGFLHKAKVHDVRQSDEHFRKLLLSPPKPHTRASALADKFVNENTMKKALEDTQNAKTLFKMKKFDNVRPRTSSKNPGYTP